MFVKSIVCVSHCGVFPFMFLINKLCSSINMTPYIVFKYFFCKWFLASTIGAFYGNTPPSSRLKSLFLRKVWRTNPRVDSPIFLIQASSKSLFTKIGIYNLKFTKRIKGNFRKLITGNLPPTCRKKGRLPTP